jgi:hypothetical protein
MVRAQIKTLLGREFRASRRLLMSIKARCAGGQLGTVACSTYQLLRALLGICYSSRPASAAREKLNEIK